MQSLTGRDAVVTGASRGIGRVRVMTIVAALCLTACASATAGGAPGAHPAPIEISKRGYHAAAYDSESDRIIVFGGQPDGNHVIADTWTYDIAANHWAQMSPAQSPGLAEGPMAYDSAADRTILFVGNSEDATFTNLPGKPLGIDRASQTWAYDDNADSWTDLKAVGGPSGLVGARMVYAAQSDRIILFGGLDVPLPPDLDAKKYIFHAETWAYDFHTNTWTNLRPKASPPGRNYFQMVYDSTLDRVLVWGASTAGAADDVWAYDFATNTWAELKSARQPADRFYGAMAYVPTLKQAFLFGGVDLNPESPAGDLWTYDAAARAWEQVSFASGPGARGWHTLTYSAQSDQLILIGGGPDPDHFTNEVWLLDPHTKAWTQVGPR